MKNVFKITLALTLVVVMAAGCQQKTSTKKKSSTSSGLNGNTGTITDPNSGTVSGCNGVPRSDATRCYYKNIPKITLNGAGTVSQGVNVSVIGPVLWSSKYNLPGYDQYSLTSDLTFNMRIKPEYSDAGELTVAGKSCASNYLQGFSRMKVYFMLRNPATSITTPITIQANVNSYSSKFSFDPVPKGSGEPLILEVVGIMTDHRCKLANPPAGCSNGTYWGDIPLVKATSGSVANPPTYCASFRIEYSTDSTYDLPN